jgi:release factor glutamine methyltransferase
MRLVPVPGVFKPHSDSLMLAEQLRRDPLVRGDVLDLCTGSGVLAITAARCGAAHVTAVDVSRRSLLAVGLAAIRNGVRVETVRGNLFAPLGERRFDLIVSNPPYLPSETDLVPSAGPARAWEGGTNGRLFIDRICAEVGDHLTPGGALLLLHSSLCSEQATLDALRRQDFDVHVVGRSRGALGKLLHARADMLRARGLIGQDEMEEILIFRARRRRRSIR